MNEWMNSESLTFLGRALDKSEIFNTVHECSMFSLNFFYISSGSDVSIQKSHCASETNNVFQKHLNRTWKRLRLVKCHASGVWLGIRPSIVIKEVDSGPPHTTVWFQMEDLSLTSHVTLSKLLHLSSFSVIK